MARRPYVGAIAISLRRVSTTIGALEPRAAVARVPERGWLLAAVGLIGKVLGPIGLARLIWSGAWPKSTIVLCLTNDLIWWIPFALYLYDAWPFRRGVSEARP